MARFSGDEPYLELKKESTWGTAPSWTSPIRIVGRGDDWYAPQWQADREELATNIGHGRLWKRKRGIKRLTANLRTWAFPAQVQEMIDWATKLTTNELDSYAIRFEDKNEILQHVGLKVNSLGLTAGSEIGQQALQLDYQLTGKEETEISTWTEGAYDEDDPYCFQDGTITVDSSADATVRAFNMNVANTLDAGVGTGTTIQWLDFASRRITGSVTMAYADPALSDKFKAGTLIDLSAVFTHTKVGTFDLNLGFSSAVDITSFVPRRTLNNTVLAELGFVATLGSADGSDFSVSLT